MTDRDTCDQLGPIRDRLLDGDALDEEMNAHVNSCESCHAFALALRQVDEGLETLPPIVAPEPLVARTLERVSELDLLTPMTGSVLGAVFRNLGSGLAAALGLLAKPFVMVGRGLSMPKMALVVAVPALGALMVAGVFLTVGADKSVAVTTPMVLPFSTSTVEMEEHEFEFEVDGRFGGVVNGRLGDAVTGMPTQDPAGSAGSVTLDWDMDEDGELRQGYWAENGAYQQRGDPSPQLMPRGLDLAVQDAEDQPTNGFRLEETGQGDLGIAERTEQLRRNQPVSGRDDASRDDTSGGDSPFHVMLESSLVTPATVEPADELRAEVDHANITPGFLSRRSQIEGLSFQPATGLWANTYVPGDPRWRVLGRELRASGDLDLASLASPLELRLPAPRSGALALSVRASLRRIEGRSRVLMEVGVRGSAMRAGRRPALRSMVVLDLRQGMDEASQATIRGLLEAISRRRSGADRIGIVVAGPHGGVLLEPDSFRLGQVTVMLRRAFGSGGEPTSLQEALTTAVASVGALTDSNSPLGSGLVWVVTPGLNADDARSLEGIAATGALAGVTTTAVGLQGAEVDALETLALAGHGRRWLLGDDIDTVVRGEVEAVSRVVARAVRLNIALAPGVSLVDVLGSRPLGGAEATRVRATERRLDRQLAQRLGITSDRDRDGEGVQIVVPAFYAGDTHTILLDLVVDAPGPVADVTMRYKDLLRLSNGEATERLELTRGAPARGPRERDVLRNLLTHRLANDLRQAALQARANPAQARATLAAARSRLDSARRELRALANDSALAAQIEVCQRYEAALGTATPVTRASLADSLRYASQRLLFGDPLELSGP